MSPSLIDDSAVLTQKTGAVCIRSFRNAVRDTLENLFSATCANNLLTFLTF